jgi:hypothetical protein
MSTAPAGADLVRRYLYAVDQALPERLRSDVTREIASLIEDKLEERAGDGARTEGMVIDVLREIGEPGDVARRFDPHPRYLIGPELYPLFARIAKIVLLGALGLVFLATYVPRLVTAHPLDAFLSFGALGRLVDHYYHLVLALLAQLVFTFYILERFRVKVPDFASPFDPHDLPELPAQPTDVVTFLDFAGSVAGLTVVAALVNLIPGLGLRLGANNVGPADFGLVLPVDLINAWILLGIGLMFIARSVGRWTLWLRVVHLAVGFFGVYVLYALVDGSSIHAPAALPKLAPVARMFAGVLPFIPVFALVQVGVEMYGVVRSQVRRAKAA